MNSAGSIVALIARGAQIVIAAVAMFSLTAAAAAHTQPPPPATPHAATPYTGTTAARASPSPYESGTRFFPRRSARRARRDERNHGFLLDAPQNRLSGRAPGHEFAAPAPAEGFRRASALHGDAVALEIGAARWTYRELGAIAGAIAREMTDVPHSPLIAVLASRSLSAFAGTLAVFGAGATHVALNPAHPPPRSAAVIEQSEATTIIAGNEALDALPALLRLAPGVRCVIAPESNDLSGLRRAFPDMRFIDAARMAEPAAFAAPAVQPDDLAYLVFTSGSTGAPKGIAISHGNLAVYMRNFRALAAPLSTDRVATTYELTFDVALHDMFQTWFSGATLCVVPARHLLAPARFIREQRITYWFSVASAAMLMERQGTLAPGVFPLLRTSMLCGEPLPAACAAAWAAAAPSSALYNVYGPTETTMELAFYRWHPQSSPAACRRGIVPIGVPFDDHQHILMDDGGNEIAGAGCGELLLAGPQVGRGYWKLPERTAQSFVTLPGRPGIWYRTGDRVERDESGLYHFVSRLDHQVKIRGHRIELGEIEAALREAAGTSLVAVIAHPLVGENALGLVAFVAGGAQRDAEALRRELAARLPAAMVPERIERLADLPLNANHKIDRRALVAFLEPT